MKRNSVTTLVAVIFLIVGILITAVGIPIAVKKIDISNKIEATAVITELRSYYKDGDRHWDTYVTYEVNDLQYEQRLGSYSSSFYEGKEIPIYIDKNNHRDIMSKSSRFVILLLPGIGLMFAAFGGGMLLSSVAFRKKKAALRETGMVVHAPYAGTDLNLHYTVNGRHPYQILCRWTDPETGEERIFKSENLWVDPSTVIEERGINTFPVYLEPEKKKKYAMDIDRVLDLMGQLKH